MDLKGIEEIVGIIAVPLAEGVAVSGRSRERANTGDAGLSPVGYRGSSGGAIPG